MVFYKNRTNIRLIDKIDWQVWENDPPRPMPAPVRQSGSAHKLLKQEGLVRVSKNICLPCYFVEQHGTKDAKNKPKKVATFCRLSRFPFNVSQLLQQNAQIISCIIKNVYFSKYL